MWRAGPSFVAGEFVTCVALAKAGLVVGPLCRSGRPSVPNTLGCQVYIICNSKSFHSFSFKLCQMIFHILKILCTFHKFFLIFEGC